MTSVSLLSVFRDLGRFSYNHGLTVLVFILPYLALLIAVRMLATAYAPEQPVWNWLYITLLLALYPFYIGRLIKYLAWLAGPSGETPHQLSIDAREWRRLFLVNLAVSVMVTGGLFLLILPGIYLAARFAFAEFITLLRQQGPFASLEVSWRETLEESWTLFFGALIIFSVFTLLEFALQPSPEASTAVRLTLGLTTAVLSILQTLALVVFFFRMYCLATEKAQHP